MSAIEMQLRCYLRGQGLNLTPLTLGYAWELVAQGFDPKAAARHTKNALMASLA